MKILVNDIAISTSSKRLFTKVSSDPQKVCKEIIVTYESVT